MKTKSKLRLSGAVILIAGLALALPVTSTAKRKPIMQTKPTIVLVHGAFADGSAWSKVIPLLEQDGYNVIAVQNPMTAYADDVATTKRVIDAQKGPVVAVGHSYGGAVITGATVGASNVKALVYVAAFAPEDGESLQPLLEKYPSKLGTALVPDAAGFLSIDRAKFKDAFAADVEETERKVMEATQGPISGAIFGQRFGTPGWKTIPSWNLIATEDNAINPDLQRFFAKRMKAKVTEVKSSHVPYMSQPKAVVKVIEEAAEAVAK